MFKTMFIFAIGLTLFIFLLGGISFAGDTLSPMLDIVTDAFDTLGGLGDALENAEREFNKIGK